MVFSFAFRRLSLLACGLTAVAVSSSAGAITFNFSGNSNASGNPLAASATFSVSGTTLTIVLTNTATSAATNGADVLDGVFFDIAGSNPTFSAGNVTLTSGSSLVLMNNVPTSGNPLNDEYMFDSPTPILGTEFGIGSTGFPGFNPNNDNFTARFWSGTAMSGGNSDYGTVPTAGITVGSTSNVYINNSVTFTFTLSSAISESDIENVMVSYGSGGETQLVPEPATMAAIGIGALGLLRRRRKA